MLKVRNVVSLLLVTAAMADDWEPAECADNACSL